MRRTSLLFLAVIILLGTVLIGGGRLGVAQDTGTMGHPLVGSWLLNTAPEETGEPLSVVRFSADGGYLQVDSDGSSTIGSWEATGANSANLTIVSQDEEEGSLTIRASVEADPDGVTFTAEYTLEFADPATGELSGQIGPATAVGTRIAVEGPGTPVASFEDFLGGFEGTPEATPAS